MRATSKSNENCYTSVPFNPFSPIEISEGVSDLLNHLLSQKFIKDFKKNEF